VTKNGESSPTYTVSGKIAQVVYAVLKNIALCFLAKLLNRVRNMKKSFSQYIVDVDSMRRKLICFFVKYSLPTAMKSGVKVLLH